MNGLYFKRNTPIHFTKKMPSIKDCVLLANEYYTTDDEYSIFVLMLKDLGINPVFYPYKDDHPMLKGCKCEIRISPYILMEPTLLAETDRAAINDIRFDLYYDAWHGLGNIFSRQVDPNHPIGINFTERLNLFFDDPDTSFLDFIKLTLMYLPKKDNLEDLTPYINEISLTKGEKISDYQIRLLYNELSDCFWDLVSAFRFINHSLGDFFDFQVDEG